MSNTIGTRLQVIMIVSGVGNLSQACLWLGVFCMIWSTQLNLLKYIAIMFSGMNVSWFCASVFAWLVY